MLRRSTRALCPPVILLFLLCLPACARAGPREVLAEALWRIAYSVRLDNPSAEKRELEFRMPLAPDEPPCQEVLGLAPPPGMVRRMKDGSGNTVGVWCVALPPRSGKTLKFVYTIRTRHVRWLGKTWPRRPVPRSAAPFLAPGKLVESRDRAIVSAVERLCAGEENLRYRALHLYDYIRTHYRFDPRQGIFGAAQALGKKSLQCADAALLFTAMSRAAGIPSRVAGGLFITPDKARYRELHAWSEVALPDLPWACVDPTLGRFDSGHRLRCFLERRESYVTLWRGGIAPFSVLSSGLTGRAAVTFVIEVKRLSRKAVSARKGPALPVPGMRRHSPGGAPPPDTAVRQCAEGRELERKGRRAEALRCYFAALDGAPGYLEPCQALLKMSEGGREGAAIRSGFSGRRGALPLYALGEMERREGRWSAARAHFDAAASGGFPGAQLPLARMRLFAATKEIADFEEALRAALRLEGGSMEPYREGLTFFQDLCEWDSCLSLARLGRRSFPCSGLFPGVEGFALLQKGDLPGARAAEEEAVRKEPSVGWYRCILGWILRDQGDLEGARRSIEKGITLGTGVANPEFFRSLVRRK